MRLIEKLQNKQAAVWELPGWGAVLRQQWEIKFAPHLTSVDKKAIFMSQYLWHAFSFHRLPCLQREAAVQAFRSVPQKNCYVFFQHSDHALLFEDAGSVEAEEFAQEGDVYIVDREFGWTFVMTHEGQWCGPYYLSADQLSSWPVETGQRMQRLSLQG